MILKHLDNPTSRISKAYSWGKCFIAIVWDLFETIWGARNMITHGLSPGNKKHKVILWTH